MRKFSKGVGTEGVISIEGKALRGAFARGRKGTSLHMVNVWATGARLTLAQKNASPIGP